MKICTKCKKEKNFSEFHKDSQKKSGLCSACKDCSSKIAASYYCANKDRILYVSKSYKEKNKDLVRERNKAWNSNNVESNRRASRLWQERNPDKVKEKNARWQAAHPDRSASKSRNRRARMKMSEGSHTNSDVLVIFNNQKGRCASCGCKLPTVGKDKYHVDHIVPISLGGSNWPTNLQCLCMNCNQRKHAKDPYDWAREEGRLL